MSAEENSFNILKLLKFQLFFWSVAFQPEEVAVSDVPIIYVIGEENHSEYLYTINHGLWFRLIFFVLEIMLLFDYKIVNYASNYGWFLFVTVIVINKTLNKSIKISVPKMNRGNVMRTNKGNVNRMSRDYTGKKYNNLMKKKTVLLFFVQRPIIKIFKLIIYFSLYHNII
jgi:hypothetical protein